MERKKSRELAPRGARGSAASGQEEPVNRSDFDPAHAARVEPSVRRWLATLAPFEVAAEDRWREGTDRGAIYPRECFYRAAKYLYHPSRFSEPVWVVHGETGMAINRHA